MPLVLFARSDSGRMRRRCGAGGADYPRERDPGGAAEMSHRGGMERVLTPRKKRTRAPPGLGLAIGPRCLHSSARSGQLPPLEYAASGPCLADAKVETPADVAELVDARRSGRRECKLVEVRVLSSASVQTVPCALFCPAQAAIV